MKRKNKGNNNIEITTGKYGSNVFRATVEIVFSEEVMYRSDAYEFIRHALANRLQVADWNIIDFRSEE